MPIIGILFPTLGRPGFGITGPRPYGGAMHLDDIAELIQHYREAAEKQFDSELAKLRLTYGPRVVSKALELASRGEQQRVAISISAARARHEVQRAAERRAQRQFREQHDEAASAAPLPPGWR